MKKILQKSFGSNRSHADGHVSEGVISLCQSDDNKTYKWLFITFIFLGIAFILSSSNSRASTLLSATPELEVLIEEALKNNNKLKSIVETINGLSGKESFEGALSDPKLGFALLNVPIDGFSLDQEAMTQKQVFISQKLPWPGKLKLQSLNVSAEAGRLLFLLKSKKLQTARKVVDAYFDLGFIAESIKLNQKLSELMETNLNVASVKYSSGRGLQQDIFRAQLELSSLADEKNQLEKKYRVLTDTINALLNRERYQTIRPPFVSELLNFMPAYFQSDNDYDPEPFKRMALKNNPEIGVLKCEIEKNETMIKLARKGNYPDFDLKLAYGQRDEDQMGEKRDDFLSFSTTLNIPLWKNRRQDQDLLSKKALEKAAVTRYNNLVKTLPHRIDSAVIEINKTKTSYLLYKNRLIPQSIQWAQTVVSDYEVGKTGFDSMINARFQTLKFELKAKKYLFEILKKTAELEELTGGLPGSDKEK